MNKHIALKNLQYREHARIKCHLFGGSIGEYAIIYIKGDKYYAPIHNHQLAHVAFRNASFAVAWLNRTVDYMVKRRRANNEMVMARG